ncbi:MAG: bifunctional aspartate kinase/homoserine dehydrogenase I [Deltaproteobacteria bacterium]|nr:bifunctional aspartate kinase/homoserine dehydrogenase I [Deltaproteobacteria bacterium]
MRILKFGGSTLRSAADCLAVAEVVRQAQRRDTTIVVVSALSGVTNALLACIAAAEQQRLPTLRARLRQILRHHTVLLRTAIPARLRTPLQRTLVTAGEEIEALLHGIAQVGECTARTRDRVIGYGELLSSQLIAGVLRGKHLRAVPVDARQLIVTDADFGNAVVDAAATRQRLQTAQATWRGEIPVITGFIAATPDGVPTTVGRNGSDYSAALIGALLKAREIEIWTDVDGVMSADPALVSEAFPLEQLSYAEAMELAYFGAKVLHPRAVIPAIEAGIPLRIRNLGHRGFSGTLISSATGRWARAVKGITAIADVTLLSLEGAGMVGVNGVAARMFDALARAQINVILISQGSSEQSICCVIRRQDAVRARRVVREVFAAEMARHDIRRIDCRNDIAVVAVVGAGMQGAPGVAARLFAALGKNAINVVAIAQGSSELNISVVVAAADATKAINVIHGAFHLARRHVNVVLIGKGTIGSKLLEQIAENQERLVRDRDLQVNVVGILGQREGCFTPAGLKVRQWKKLVTRGEASALSQLTKTLIESRLENLILVDATASDHVAARYPEWLAAGVSIVTPNKKANTMSQPFYDRLQQLIRRRNAYYHYETCVGAGLPVISTLQDLIDSGDTILQIEAALSGTLGFLFSELEAGRAFSAIVRDAHRRGFTEPDPREDLSGLDVARKLLILARTMGVRCTLAQVAVEPLLPKALRRGGTVAQFFRRLTTIDDAYRARVVAVAKREKVLRYIGLIKHGRCSVRLTAVERDSPFGSLRGGDNLVVFTTARYRTNPLIVRGPGAGPDVTAGGVFADILKVAHLLTTG